MTNETTMRVYSVPKLICSAISDYNSVLVYITQRSSIFETHIYYINLKAVISNYFGYRDLTCKTFKKKKTV